MFVIDSADKQRLPEALSELSKLMTEKELKDAALLILANKQVRIILYKFANSSNNLHIVKFNSN